MQNPWFFQGFLILFAVVRRWDEDRDAYTRHMDWLAQGGLRRTRQTPRQAAMTLRNLEEAKRLLEAEEACDDPVRMIPYLLENKAVRVRQIKNDLPCQPVLDPLHSRR